jgi:hypothetical protein
LPGSDSPQALAWGATAPELFENHLNGFQELNAPRNPKLKLGENEKGPLTTNCNVCVYNQQLALQTGLK